MPTSRGLASSAARFIAVVACLLLLPTHGALAASFTLACSSTTASTGPHEINVNGPGSLSDTLAISGLSTGDVVTFNLVGGTGNGRSGTVSQTGGTATGTGVPTTVNLDAVGSTGTIVYTATSAGTANMTITESTAANGAHKMDWTATCVRPVTINLAPSSPLPGGFQNVSYSQTITASGGTSPYTFATTAGALPTGLSLSSGGVLSGTPTASGTFNFTITATDNVGNTGLLAYALTIAAAPTITTTSPLPAGTFGSTYNQTLLATGGTPGYTFALAGGALPGGLSLAANGDITGTASATGVFSFTARVTGSNTATSTKLFSLTINKADQAIVFGALGNKTVGDAAFTVTATGGGSGNAVTFATLSTACSVTPTGTVTILAAGACAITASQAGNANYTAATDVTQSFTVNQAAQTIVFGALGDKTVGDADFTVSATGGASGNAVTFATTSPACSVTPTGTVTILAAGSCAITASQAGNANYNAAPDVTQSFTVDQAAQAIVFGALGNKTVGDADFTVTATGGGSGNAVTFATTSTACSVTPTGTVTILAAGSCAITASQAGDGNYAAAPEQTVTFSIGAAGQTISVTDPGTQTFASGGTVSLTGTASSGLPVSYASTTPAVCTVSGATVTMVSAGSCAITASQAGNGNYSAAPDVALTFALDKPPQLTIIVTAERTSMPFGDTSLLTTTGGSGSGAVTYSILSGSEFCRIEGGQVIAIGVGTCVVEVVKAGDDQYAAAITTVTIAVTALATEVALGSAPNPSAEGDEVTLIASVSSGVPDGTVVTFTAGSTVLGTALVVGGEARLVTSALPVGATSITAAIAGGTGFLGATSDPLVQTVAPASDTTTVETIASFVGERNDLLLQNDPSTPRQVDRLIEFNEESGGSAGGSAFAGSGLAAAALSGPAALRPPAIGDSSFDDGARSFSHYAKLPFAMTGSTEAGTQLSFATSLREMAYYAESHEAGRDQAALALAGGDVPGAQRQRHKPSRFDAWVEGHYAEFGDERATGDLDGEFAVAYAGADWVINPSILIGVMAQYDWLSLSSTATTGEIDGKGWMVGPYATIKLSDNIYWQGRAAWGGSDNEVSPTGSYTDSFGSRRWLATGKLVGRWQHGDLTFSPVVGLSYIEDTTETYIDTLGSTIPGVRTSLGQAVFGPEFSYRLVTAGGLVEPRLGLQGIWNYSADQEAAGVILTEGPDEELRAKLDLGLKYTGTNGIVIDLSGSYDGIGSSSYEAISGRAAVRVPLE